MNQSFSHSFCSPVLHAVTQVPSIGDNVIRNLCIDYFGLNPKGIDRLNGYDDKNYHLTNVASLFTNPNLDKICLDGYVLKITNVEDSASEDLVEGQNALLRHLKAKGLPVPKLVKCKRGEDLVRTFVNYATNGQEVTGGTHVVRILHFIPGVTIDRVQCSADIVRKVGHLLARVHNALEDFRHVSFENKPGGPWSLYNVNWIKQVLHVIDDEFRKQLVSQVVESFNETVVRRFSSLKTGQIHGDFNEQNILVSQNDGGDVELCGILDVGDSQRGCLIFDVAIGIAYMTLIANDVPLLEIGGHFLAGYMAERTIAKDELRLLRVCICARYCQSLAFGLYSYQQNPTPENAYVLITQRNGWPKLIALWQTSDSALYQSWSRVLSASGVYDVL